MKKLFSGFLSVFTLLLIWQLLSIFADNELVLPSFISTAEKFVKLAAEKSFYVSLWHTTVRVFVSFGLSVLAGTVLGLFCGIFPAANAFFSFPLVLIRSTPVVAFILLAIFIFDSSFVPVFSAFLMGFPIMTANTQAAFSPSADRKKLHQMTSVYGLNKSQFFRFAFLPEFLPFFLSGIQSVFGMSWKVVAAAEVLSVPKNALGSMLQSAQVHLESAELLAVSLCLVLLCFLIQFFSKILFRLFKNLYKKWRAGKIEKLIENSSETNIIPLKTDSSQNPDVNIENLNLKLGNKNLFENFCISFKKNTITAILAPSGEGKTTLLNCVAQNEAKNRTSISFAFQEARLLSGATVFQNIYEPLKNIMPQKQASVRASEYLKAVNLHSRLKDSVSDLSGGEKQRLSIARAFSFPSKILLLDEPFQGLDLHIKIKLMNHLLELQQHEKRTVIFVTHDIYEAVYISDRILAMKGQPVKILLDEETNKADKNSTATQLYKIMI